jgi:hypothetical protein
MKTADNGSATLRHSESGKVWEEKLSGATGSIEVGEYTTFRVRATGATTVTIDGVLAMTMSAGEIAIFNAGTGNPDDTKPTVTIVIGDASAFVQVARELDRQKLLS